MNEKDLKHNIHIDISMYNSKGVLTPSAYQRMIMNMIEEHLDSLNMGEKYLMENHGISWVLLSCSIEMHRKIHPTDELCGITWHAGGRMPSFRRDFTFSDKNGEVVAVGATTSTLFENATRRICLNKEKLSVIAVEPQPPILERLERKNKLDGEPVFIERRKIRPSMTDGVGHVNNTKYGDFVYDAMSEEERASLDKLSRLDVWFISELLEGEEFDIFKDDSRSTSLSFIGVKCGESRPAFEMRMTFFE